MLKSFFNSNAWLEQQVCMEMSEQTLLPFIEEYGLSKFVLLIDNLKGKMQEDFKTAVFSANGLLWFGLPDSPDFGNQ